MSKTSHLRAQHGEIGAMVQKIFQLLDPEHLCVNGGGVHRLLTLLADKIAQHLSIEDEMLYPSMLGSSETQVKATAKSFVDEMGELSRVFMGYIERWDRVSIEESPLDFIEETKGLFKVLGQRIERETAVLYPLADSLAA